MKIHISQLGTVGIAVASALALSLAFGPSPASAAASDARLALPETFRDTVVTNVTDSVRIFFPLGKSVLDVGFGGNPASFGLLGTFLHPGQNAWSVPQSVRFVGGASPEGGVRLNASLSAKRAWAAADYVRSNYGSLGGIPSEETSVGRDWEGLLECVRLDPAVPYKDRTLAFLEGVVANVKAHGEKDSDNYVRQLEDLEDGAPYYYLSEYVFPKLRSAKLVVNYDLVSVVETETVGPEPEPEPEPGPEPVFEPVVEPEPVSEPKCRECRPFYMDITTNMLYDLAMTPNLGIEFYLGRRWSLQADWQYAWWKKDAKAFYWRTYGGDFTVRKWMGRKSKEKPLQGHHLGLYAQMYTYDFEFGGYGYLADTWNWGVGLEYGYSLPVTPRLNIDFSIGVGYSWGQNYKYDPEDMHYYWDETHRTSYVGPTRAEISLVWLIGCGNYNHKGRRADK